MWCRAITRKRALLNGHHSPIGGTCSNFIIPIRWGLPTVIFLHGRPLLRGLEEDMYGGPLEILRFFLKCWQGLSFFAASRRVSLCNKPSFIAHEKCFRTKLTDAFLGNFLSKYQYKVFFFFQNRGFVVTTTCIQALSCFYSACLFSHSKHVLFSLTHWYFLVRTFFDQKCYFAALQFVFYVTAIA